MNMTAADWVNTDQWNKVDIRNRDNQVDRDTKNHEWEVAEKKSEWSKSNIVDEKKHNKENDE